MTIRYYYYEDKSEKLLQKYHTWENCTHMTILIGT